MGLLKPKLRELLVGSSRGFTLAELLVSVAILGVGMGLIGGGLYQALGIWRFWSDDVIATKEVRHVTSWFAGDAMNAESTDLVDGDPPSSSVILTWTDGDDATHTATYNLSGSNLMRDLDGAQITLARRVVSVGFSLSGKVLTLDLEVEAERGGTESISLQTYLRMLP